MDIESLKIKIEEAESRICSHEEYIIKTKKEMAEYLCPFKVGDEVINGSGGKEIIASINYKSYGSNYSFDVFRIRKNGEPYKFSCSVWSERGYTKFNTNI